jgi:hypothetical protein
LDIWKHVPNLGNEQNKVEQNEQTIENYGNLNKFFVKKNEYVHWIWALKTINASLVLKG